MVSGFLTKKIKSKRTLGEKLKSARQKQQITISAAEEATKVRAKYLVALEEGDWKILPQNVYVRAYVLSYAKFLELSKPEITDLLETELIFHRKNQRSQELAYNNSVKDAKVLITPKVLAYFGLGVFVLSLFSYIFLQVSNFAGSPNLKVFTPENNSIVETDEIDVKGATDHGTMLTVNNENIPVTSDGGFFLNLKLHRGVNVIKINAINKTKKESSQVLTIEYKPKTASIFETLSKD